MDKITLIKIKGLLVKELDNIMVSQASLYMGDGDWYAGIAKGIKNAIRIVEKEINKI